MVRTSALFSLLVILTAPEFFTLFLPQVWQPMLVTFQLMIVYTILDPLSLAANQLLLATGHPKTVTRIRWLQLAVFVPAVVAGAAWWGIEGVALAADLMMLVGVLLLYRAVRLVVDFSALALWRWPILAAGLVAVATLGVDRLLEGMGPAWLLALKAIVVSVLFALILYLTEREQLLSGAKMIWGLVKPHKKLDQPDEQSDDRRP
jgi:O-antigen/teichoic acid export membrane protein